MQRILLKNGRIWDGEEFFNTDIFIERGKIVKIADGISEKADFTEDVSGKIVTAGHVDMHTHLRGIFPDTVSTDLTKVSMYTRGGKYGLTMCMSLAKNAGMSEADVFRAVTSTHTKVLGMENDCGYIKEGATADIAVIEETTEAKYKRTDMFGNAVSSQKGYQCLLTVSNGEVVYRR